jgi:hypothetical protein
MLIKLILFIFSMSFISCEKADDYAYYANPPRQGKIESNFRVKEFFDDDQVDILWVVDNSGSMGSIQRNIIKNSALFMDNFLKESSSDWRMGLISTDNSDDPYLGFSKLFDSHYAKTVPANRVVEEFKDAVEELGVYGSGSEYVFYNAHRMMTSSLHNSFFRNRAHLAVIMVTDEREQSQNEYGGKFEVQTFLNTVRGLKAKGRIVRFYGAFDLKDLENCRYSVEGTYKGSPYDFIITNTGGIHMSACTEDFGKKLAEIGKDILTLGSPPKILIKERPVIDSIKVYYRGKLIPGGSRANGGLWYYSEKYSSITFYNMDFVDDIENGEINVFYDIDDGVDRVEQK